MSIRAVLDTNVVISGIFWKGTPFRILEAWQKGRFTLILSPPILDEYRRVLQEMTRKRPIAALTSILEIIESNSQITTPSPFSKHVCSDPDDDKFLEAALAARANHLVTGDSALLKLRKFQGTQIVTPQQFLGLLPP